MSLGDQTDTAKHRDTGEDEKDKRSHNLFGSQRDDQPRKKQISHGERKQKDPGEAHQLVVTEARQCGPDPDEDEEQNSDLSAKPKERHQDGFQGRDKKRGTE